jgi:uncharacterized protein
MMERARFAAKYWWVSGAAILVLALVVARYGWPPGKFSPDAVRPPGNVPGSKTAITILTSGTGGAYYPLGSAFARVLSQSLPNVAVSTEVTGGSVDNLDRIGAHKSEIGFAIGDVALEATKGEERFASGKVALRALIALFPNHLHLVTVEGGGIEKIADLKGKRVSTGVPGSATEATALRLLAAVGLDKDKDLKRERYSPAEAAEAVKGKKLDAFFWLGAVPTRAITELAAAAPPKMKLIDSAGAIAAINAKYGRLYTAGVVAAGSYPGQDKDCRDAEIWNLLVADERLADDLAYEIVKTVFEKKPELVALRREAESLALSAQTPENSPIPFHPGAIRYFKERGLGF